MPPADVRTVAGPVASGTAMARGTRSGPSISKEHRAEAPRRSPAPCCCSARDWLERSGRFAANSASNPPCSSLRKPEPTSSGFRLSGAVVEAPALMRGKKKQGASTAEVNDEARPPPGWAEVAWFPAAARQAEPGSRPFPEAPRRAASAKSTLAHWPEQHPSPPAHASPGPLPHPTYQYPAWTRFPPCTDPTVLSTSRN